MFNSIRKEYIARAFIAGNVEEIRASRAELYRTLRMERETSRALITTNGAETNYERLNKLNDGVHLGQLGG